VSQSKKILSTSGVSQAGQGQSSPLGEGGNNTGLFNISTYQFGKTGNYGQTRNYINLENGEIDTGVDLSGTPSTDIDDYYSVDMWTGQQPYGQEIVNGIDMINNKTMTFIKGHSSNKQQNNNNLLANESSPMFLDSERGNSKVFFSNRGPYGNYRSESTLQNDSNFFQYTTSGYKWGYGSNQTTLCLNTIGQRYLGYTFRAKPKFFDVVKWTGDGTYNRQISHNLQSVPEFMIIRRTDNYDIDTLFILNASDFGGTFKYKLYPEMEGSHSSVGQSGTWYNSTTGALSSIGPYGNQTFSTQKNLGNGTSVVAPTSSNFTVGHDANLADSGFTNQNGKEYIAYLWASDSSSSSMIKCGSFSGAQFNVNLGWRPQTIWIFPYNSSMSLGQFGTADLLLDKKLYWGSNSYAGDVLIRRPWSFWNSTSHNQTQSQMGHTSYHEGGTSGNTVMSVHSQGFKGDAAIYTSNQLFHADTSNFYVAIRDSEYTWSNTSTNKGFYFWGNTKREKTIDTTNDGNRHIRMRYSDNQVIDTVRANHQQVGPVGSDNSSQPDQLQYAYGSFQGYYGSNGHFSGSGMRYFDRTKLGIHPVAPVSSDSGKYFIWGMKAYPKFFDIVEWTGDGTANRQISHNLQSTPAMIILSEANTSTDRYPRVWHKDLPNSMGFLDTKDQFQPNYYSNWGNQHDTAHPYKVFGGTSSAVATPTSTYFTVSHAEGVSGGYPDNHSPPVYRTKRAGNNNGVKYYAYLFADQKTTGNIAVGSYTGNGMSTWQAGNTSIYYERPASNLASAYGPSLYDSGVFVDLGWEPQWIMVKNMNRYQTCWTMFDTTRGWDWHQGEAYDATSQYNDLSPHNIGVRGIFNRGKFHHSADVGHPMTNGFEVRGIGNLNGTTAQAAPGGIYSGVSYGSNNLESANSYNWNIAGDQYLYVAIRRDEISPTEGKQIYAISRGKNLVSGQGDQFSFGTGIHYPGLNSHPLGPISSTSTYNDHQNPVLFKPDLAIVNDANSNSSSYNMMRIMTRGWGTYAPSVTTNTNYDARRSSDLWPQTGQTSANPFSQSSGFGITYPQSKGTWNNGSTSTDPRIYTHMFKRAKGFMDIIHYRGSGTSMTKPHALGVAPEMLIFKMARFSLTTYSSYNSLHSGWEVFHKDLTPAGSGDWTTMKVMFGLGTGSHTTDTSGQGTYRADDSMTNTSTPNYVGDGTIGVGSTDDASGSHFAATPISVSSTDITVGGGTSANTSGSDPYYHQCIMFATLPGVSKVGYYLGNGTSTVNVNCGFSSGARFVLIKREDDKGPWVVLEGGDGHQVSGNYYQSNIRSGSDHVTFLNRKDVVPSASGRDYVEPNSNGFSVLANSYTVGSIQSQPHMGGVPINVNGARYIFLAIA